MAKPILKTTKTLSPTHQKNSPRTNTTTTIT